MTPPSHLRSTKRPEAQELTGFPLLAGLKPAELGSLASSSNTKEFMAGDVLVERGATDRDVYLILSGELLVADFSPTGRIVSLATLGRGDIFGELAAIDEGPRSATVVARGPGEAIVVPPEYFMDLVVNNPDIAVTLLRRLAGIVRLGDDRIADLSLLTAEQRVCAELLRLAAPDPAVPQQSSVFPVPTQETLAAMVGVTRKTVSRVFKHLTTLEVIERKG